MTSELIIEITLLVSAPMKKPIIVIYYKIGIKSSHSHLEKAVEKLGINNCKVY